MTQSFLPTGSEIKGLRDRESVGCRDYGGKATLSGLGGWYYLTGRCFYEGQHKKHCGLELEASQVKVIDQKAVPAKKKTAQQLAEDRRRRKEAMATFMGGMLKELSLENRKKGGDGNVSGVVIE